jgi:hypothetical protein
LGSDTGTGCGASRRRIEQSDESDDQNADHGNEPELDVGKIDQLRFTVHEALLDPYDSGAGRVEDQQAESGGDGKDERKLDEEAQDAVKAWFAGHDSLTARSARR